MSGPAPPKSRGPLLPSGSAGPYFLASSDGKCSQSGVDFAAVAASGRWRAYSRCLALSSHKPRWNSRGIHAKTCYSSSSKIAVSITQRRSVAGLPVRLLERT